MKQSRRRTIASWLIFILASSLLFLGFYRDQWQMARPKKFSIFQKDVEAYVIGRLVLARQSGIFSNGGLLGWGDVDGTRMSDIGDADYQHQYDTYLNGLTFKSYLAKQSHPGFQAIFFSALDRISPLGPSYNLRLFRMLTAGLFALTLGGVLLWFLWELGWLPAILVFASILVSQWMTLFGRNLFFVAGFFYLPMLALLFALYRQRPGSLPSRGSVFWIVFSTLLLKCLFNGFDFILPALCMAATPLVYYGVRDRWNRDVFLSRFMIAVLAALAAIFASLVILSIQVMYASGSFAQGIGSILGTVNRRILVSDPNLVSLYAQAKNASMGSILKIYLTESYFDRYTVPYFVIILLFAVVSVAQILLERRQPAQTSFKGYALIAATWFSLLGPLSWYTIFKSVAYFHTHMNYLPWHMPFTLFGFGLCGFFLRSLFGRLNWENLNPAIHGRSKQSH